MLELLERASALAHAGARVRVAAFDTEDEDADRTMAARLAALQRARPDETLLVLAGNVHTRSVPGLEGDPGFLPMGYHLRRARVPAVFVAGAHAAGAAWTCEDESPAHCGANAWPATSVRAADAGTLVLDRARAPAGGYDGWVFVGPLHASTPARDPR
jgi:hypothetical protein